MFDFYIDKFKNLNKIETIRECFLLSNPMVNIRNIDVFIYNTGKIDILTEAFEKAIYKYSEENIDSCINIVKNWININYPFAKLMFKYDYIKEKLVEYQNDREIMYKINNYIVNGTIIYSEPLNIMDALKITDKKWLRYITQQLRGVGIK